MDKHTPGPWNVNTTKVDGAIVRWHIASDKHGSVYPVCEHVIECEPSGAEQLANASLIAAAPELLVALEQALEQAIFPGVTISDAYNNARAAVAKATGSQP